MISPTQRTLPDKTQHTKETGIYAQGGFELAIRASELPQTHVLDHAATGIGSECNQILRGKKCMRIRKVDREYPAHYVNSALTIARYQWHE